jgi:hypothetical protein
LYFRCRGGIGVGIPWLFSGNGNLSVVGGDPDVASSEETRMFGHVGKRKFNSLSRIRSSQETRMFRDVSFDRNLGFDPHGYFLRYIEVSPQLVSSFEFGVLESRFFLATIFVRPFYSFEFGVLESRFFLFVSVAQLV